MPDNEQDNGYFLGIDLGTQGLTVLLTDRDLHVVATGEASYGFVSHEPHPPSLGVYEQTTTDWEHALHVACRQVYTQFLAKQQQQQQQNQQQASLQILAIGISGQMHGEVLMDQRGQAINPVRLWCDGRNADEAALLTEALGTKCPQRMTAVRFLWTATHQPQRAAATRRLTTPAGWLAYRFTGQVVLGIGDAAGMFPVTDHAYDADKMDIYNQLLSQQQQQQQSDTKILLQDLLPEIRRAGQDAGSVTVDGAKLLVGLLGPDATNANNSLSSTLVGIPVASAEGDQVAALAGSLVGTAGTVACSFGTSVCANVVAGPSRFVGVSPAIDHFCAADGQPIHMVWLRNGTTFFNTTVAAFRQANNQESIGDAFDRLMPEVLQARPDCGGLLAMPFMDDEPGLGVTSGPSTATILGWTPNNATAGNVIKAALLSTMMNLKSGVDVLVHEQGVVELHQIVLSGGLVKTAGMGQVVADVFNCPVRLLAAADEGSSWGAAVMAAYRYQAVVVRQDSNEDATTTTLVSWSDFLEQVARQRALPISFTPQAKAVQEYQRVYAKYQKLRTVEKSLRDLQRED